MARVAPSSSSASTSAAWRASKAAALDPLLDRSLAGGIDPPIAPLCEFLNNQPDFYTTSSCSGRVVLFWQRGREEQEQEQQQEQEQEEEEEEEPSIERTKANGGSWLYITHDPEPSYETMMESARALPSTGLVVFKQEPFLLHVRCRTLAAAAVLYQLARDSGLRESGLVRGGVSILCAVHAGCDLPVPRLFLPRNSEWKRLAVESPWSRFPSECQRF
jgi:tRNA wybutosine-synthesizing protein 3